MTRIWNKHKQTNTPLKRKVFVGLSGGVDSSVSLLLLKKAGFDVVGVFIKVWNPDFLECSWRDERMSAMRVCANLGVPFKTLDCEKEYKEKIVDYMISEYKKGRTPNPDVFCNKYIKFGVFMSEALKHGADFVATGHYAQKIEKGDGNFLLKKAVDSSKDQSYFLSQINQKQLQKILFPIGHLQKSEVRKIARESGLPTAEKKDSQGLCFVGKVDMKDFLAHFIDIKEGNIIDQEENLLGKHRGVPFYTIGERVSISGSQKTPQTSRFFIISKDIEKNILVVSDMKKENDEGAYSSSQILISNTNFISERPKEKTDYNVCFRYHQAENKCRLKFFDDKKDQVLLYMEKEQTDLASGQIAVIYDGDICIGSGVVM